MKQFAVFTLLVVLTSGCSGKMEGETEGKTEELTKAEKRAKETAIAAIEKLGGIVAFDEKRPDKPVIGVGLSHTRMTDAGLFHLKALTKLDYLYLDDTKISDLGLVHLTGLTKLQYLNLSGTNVTASGVKKLQAALPKCEITR